MRGAVATEKIIPVMPLTMPLAAWIVFSGTGGNHQQTADFVRSMCAAYLPTLVFIAALWYGLRQAWAFPLVIGFLSAWSDQYISARWTNAIVFSILILVLVFRPHGLMGERTPDKA